MGSYKVLIKPSAVKELEAISKKDRGHIANRIAALSRDPRPPGCEKLTARENYRVRQGVYRIVYSVSDADETVIVVKVGHRREVYR